MWCWNADDFWNIEGNGDLSDSWTGFTRFTLSEGRPPDVYTWSGERLTKKQTTSRPDYLWPEIWKICQKQRNEKKNKNGLSRNQSLITPEDCSVLTSLIQRMKRSKKLWKKARRKLEVPIAAAMPCKIWGGKYRETCRTTEIRKTKYACIVEADESMRKRLERTLHEDHEVHNAGKRINSLPKQWKYQTQKQQWRKNGKNSRKYQHGSSRKSETKMKWSMKQGMRQNRTLCVVNGYLSSQEFGVGTNNFKNTKVESYSEVTLLKMIRDLMQYSLSRDHRHHKWRLQK